LLFPFKPRRLLFGCLLRHRLDDFMLPSGKRITFPGPALLKSRLSFCFVYRSRIGMGFGPVRFDAHKSFCYGPASHIVLSRDRVARFLTFDAYVAGAALFLKRSNHLISAIVRPGYSRFSRLYRAALAHKPNAPHRTFSLPLCFWPRPRPHIAHGPSFHIKPPPP
jgi:hypothetical protein